MTRFIGTGVDPRYPENVVVDISPDNRSEMTLVDQGLVKEIGLDQDPARDVSQLAGAAVRGDLGSGNLNDPVEVALAAKAGLLQEDGSASPHAYDIVHGSEQPSGDELTKVGGANALIGEGAEDLQPRDRASLQDDQEGELTVAVHEAPSDEEQAVSGAKLTNPGSAEAEGEGTLQGEGADAADGEAGQDQYDDLTGDQLRDELEARGLVKSGTNDELRARLRESDDGDDE